jgi:CSLREA domain-containing protein
LAAVPARGNTRVHGNRAAFGLLAALACALIALAAVPVLASAAQEFVVDSTGDAPKTAVGPVCETETGECTLRAAIEAANTNTLYDEIVFDPGVFDGAAPASTISLGSPLPAIVHGVEIDAGRCPTTYGVEGPCAEVAGLPASSSAPNVFTVSGEYVTIRDLAIEGGLNGILDTEPGGAFTAVGDWFGIELNGGRNGGSFKSGVLVEADDAIIGGETRGDYEEDRNVFGLSQIGVDVQGSSHTSIQGNYIGVGPTGRGSASLEVGVRIVDVESASRSAKVDEVGGILTAGQVASPECDGPCNVIATEGGNAVDLTGLPGEGVKAASGPIWIRGNYLGLAANGIDPVGENSYGVFAAPTEFGCEAGPADVTVGGSAPTETNYIDGGSGGLFAEGAQNFSASGNAIGVLPDGMAGESPGVGISLCAHGVTERAHISANEMDLEPTALGIDSEYGAADITGNAIQGGQIGVFALGESEGRGDLIQGNRISSPDTVGIRILNQSNTVIGNSIEDAGDWGIELEGEADHNRIGGDSPGEANDIDRSQSGAIVIDGIESTRDEVAANTGFGNSEAFLQLISQSTDEAPNGGIKPPPLTTVQQSTATGTAKPGATVRIFRKASAEGGELGALLAVVTAGAGGNWKASYATVPVGSLVAATQTTEAGTPEGATSEVSAPVAAAADPPVEPGGGGSGGPNGGGSSTATPQPPAPLAPGAPSKPKAPKVTITKGPQKSSKSTTAKFTFKATPAARAKFQCKLDNAKWAPCKSPKTYKNLKPRKHTFQVRATVSGVTGAAAKFKFRVVALESWRPR